MRLTKGIQVSEENVSDLEYIQKKISIVFALLTFFLLLVLGISDIFLEMSPVIIFAKLLFSIPFLVSYFLISKYGKVQLSLDILLTLGYVVIMLNFLYNDGYNGPTLYSFFLMLVASTLLIKGWRKVFWFVLPFACYMTLFYGQVQGWVPVSSSYESELNMFFDHFVTLMWMGGFIFLGINFFVQSYKNQNEVLHQLKAKQEQMLDELNTLSSEKSRLIAILSHDMRNPISMLHTTLGLMEKDAFEPGEAERILSNLKKQSYQLNNILNNTLSWVMSELEDRPQEILEISPVNLTNEMKNTMEVQAAEKSQKISFSWKGEDQKIRLEVNEIRIILKNLIDNAIKFSPLEATVELSLDIDSERIQWSVCNPGVQIPPEQQQKLFEFRARTSYGTKREKGAGIGLPLCKRIADKINGELYYDGSRDGMNCFFITKKRS
ncbi:HAMP domain-containing sensor histidine kinase [Algoriphagus halophytocola]|uniref:histidine kinase n=1 Tax=Algoriphagus halophytocola TaxID=2991499 RepID=A0ABY6MFR5_9BACT|nr:MULTISPECIES: HAMP domain-containing sensor histidine kinase [unclassified Algoriphagus]UZD22655.1 HAMP domain-containing histidine kinase [Algoriphagus sp. TR-M5]WBL43920.1 HAMP domain-containing sensor histidine kinase [Algoriphagus sp. TR-M9]